jgi:LPXTG-motif cell wall-anchored protein
LVTLYCNFDFIGSKDARAHEERTVVAANFSNTTTHWDKTTDVLTQLDWRQTPDLTVHWLIEKTSLWGETGIDIILLVGFGIAIAAGLLIIFLFFRRKKKKSENEQKS